MAILVRTGAILVFLSVFPGAERVSGQRAPCYQCEDYKENHPQTSPYQQIRTHCTYPCECEDKEPTCPPDVSVIRDGCGCCPICASQLGQPCDGNSVCDDRKGLVCRYPYLGASVGVCQATTGLPCMVSNKTYNHGETFHMDCRTQCSCQNGTYACSSLCPNENISPRGACTHPRLVEVPDQCCREWMCDSTEAEHPPVCKQEFTSWSACSAPCGLGISRRISNLNQDCVLQNETRICQLRPCEAGMLSLEQHARHHHIRKGHECKATQRVSGPVRLRFGPCRSKKRYRPKFCGSCDDKVGDGCCTPQLSTTIKVEFICDSIRKYEDPDDILLDLIEPGRDLWWPDDLLAIGRQQQQQQQSEVRSTTSSFLNVGLTLNDTEDKSTTASKKLVFRSKSDDFEKFRESLGWESRKKSGNSKKQKQIPYYDYPGKSQYNSKSPPPVSKADMHLLENKNKLDEPLLGADVLVYEPGYDERNYRLVDGRSGVDLVTASIKNEEDSVTGMRTTEQLTTEAATTETTTLKPKKKKKKKPRKAFTSWLEFRDEEYQMDEYEDEEEEQNRKKRSVNTSWDVSGKVVKRTHRDGDITEKITNRSEERDKRSPGSFREGHLEDSDDEYEDDDENDEEDEDDIDDDEEDDDDEDDDRDGPARKPLVYSFYRRKRGAPKVLDYRSLDNVPKSSQFLTAQERLKKKKLKKEKEGKYKNQIERKSNLLKKIMKVSSTKEMEKHNQESRKRKNKKIKHKETLKEQKMNPPESRTIDKTLSKLERIVKERKDAFNKSGQLDSVMTRPHPKKETFFHTAGKVHKSRTKRHAPRPPWTDDEGVESEDLTWGDHSVSFSVQWIVKCHCERDCGLETTTASSSELNNDGEIILRRVHRTAPP